MARWVLIRLNHVPLVELKSIYFSEILLVCVQTLVDTSDLEPTNKALSDVCAVCDRNSLTYKTAKDLGTIITNIEYGMCVD